MKTTVYTIILYTHNRDFCTWRKNRSCSWRSKPNNRTRWGKLYLYPDTHRVLFTGGGGYWP